MAEERLTDDPLKRSLEEGELGLEDLGVETDYDEDLVGLTPTQLEEKMEARRRAAERAQAEHDRFFAEAEQKFAEGAFGEAAAFYEQAAFYEEEGGPSALKYWECRTSGFSDAEVFCDGGTAEKFCSAPSSVRAAVLEKTRAPLTALRDEADREVAPLREAVYGGMESRRDAFRKNRNYYLVRFLTALAVLLCMGIACGVAASFIIRTRGLAAPVCTAVFGGVAAAAFAVTVVFARGLVSAQRLVHDNEELSATEDGARLQALEARIRAADLALSGPAETDGEGPSAEED